MENVVRFGKNLALIDFDGAHNIGEDHYEEKMGGASSKFCTGVMPPEMVARIDLVSDFPKLRQHEEYWRRVSEDAKDLHLLTPDDIQTISTVLKSLLAKAVARNLRKAVPRSLREEMGEIYSGLEDQDDWKDILSISLMTITFEDLPLSLSCCQDVDEFAEVWNRLLFHSRLWGKVKPRLTPDDRYAFLIKSFDDGMDGYGTRGSSITSRGDRDETTLPYDLVVPSESIDVWGFGVLLYALCSGGTLFHVGFGGDLRGSQDYSELHGWSRQTAQRILRDKIEDPLAQDLLSRILLPTGHRIDSMSSVLKHPFFGPSSNLEAQHILEKHEEQQLSIEETVVVKRMTTATRRKIERAMERQCKILFDEDKIVVPTCLVVLPYVLNEANGLRVGSDDSEAKAAELGTYLLGINQVTATASFCLMLKQVIGTGKNGFRQWIRPRVKRSRSQSSKTVCAEILKELGCGQEYMAMCMSLLDRGESFGDEYMDDPMKHARVRIGRLTDKILQLYRDGQYLYLIDEMNGVPVVSPEETDDDGDDEGLTSNHESVYPIEIDESKPSLRNLLLPFMNLAVMKLTASDGLRGMAKLLGLAPSFRIPGGWEATKVGFVHNPDKPSTIAEFAVLHQVMRFQERTLQAQAGTLTSGQSTGENMPLDNVFDSARDLALLEDFFRDHDPVRTFSGLHRVSDGRENSPAIWTTEEEVNRIEGELELASVEHKLRELKKEWIQKQKLKEEIAMLTDQIHRLQRSGRNGHSQYDRTNDPIGVRASPAPPSPNVITGGRNGDAGMRNGSIPDRGRAGASTASDLNNEPPYRSYSLAESDGHSSVILDPERAAAVARKRRRKKMRIRPYFGVC